MTTEATNNDIGNPLENHKKLSIQVSLNGLSFCVLDTANDTVLQAEKTVFAKKSTPYGALKQLKALFLRYDIRLHRFSEVIVIHRNNLFGLVPKLLFDEKELPNYLKFNTKILANDHMAYDEIEQLDMVNVFVPLVNINNFIYEGFGAFTFKHHGTVILESLFERTAIKIRANPNARDQAYSTENPSGTARRTVGTQVADLRSQAKEPVCYVHIFERQIDIAVIVQRKLLLFNSFDFVTKEDFLYYLLFTLEQLQLDTDAVAVKLFGDIEEGDDLYELCYRYILNLSIIVPDFSDRVFENTTEASLDFTVLNAL